MTTYDPNTLIQELYKGQNTTTSTPMLPGNVAPVAQPQMITQDQLMASLAGKTIGSTPVTTTKVAAPAPVATKTVVKAPVATKVAAPAPVVTTPIVNPSTPTTPTTPEVPAPTIGDLYGTGNTTADLNKAQTNYNTYLNNPDAYLTSEGISRQDLKNKAIAEMQAQIDATNAYYANQLAAAKVAGQGKLGSSTAIQGRRGMLGSDFGAAITDTVNNANTETYNAIDAERNAKIQAIMTQAQTAADTRYTEQKAAKEAGLKNYIESLKGKQSQIKTGAEDAAKALLAAGIDVKHLTEQQLADYASSDKGYGTTPAAIKAAMEAAAYTKSTADAKEKADREAKLADQIALEKSKNVSLSEGGRLYDSTGKQIAYNPKTYAPKTSTTESTIPMTAEGKTNKLNQLTNIKGLIDKVGTLADSSGSNTLWEKTKETFGGATPYTNLVAQTNALRVQAMTVLADPNNKKFFGPSMSNADVQLMMAGGNPMNPELQTPEELKASLANLSKAVAEIENNIKTGKVNQVAETPSTPVGQIIYNGVVYNQDANGDLTPAE